MPIRKLAGIVTALVLLTGLAVGLYVDALRAHPVQAAEVEGCDDSPTLLKRATLVQLQGSRDDVRARRSTFSGGSSEAPGLGCQRASSERITPGVSEAADRVQGALRWLGDVRPCLEVEPSPCTPTRS